MDQFASGAQYVPALVPVTSGSTDPTCARLKDEAIVKVIAGEPHSFKPQIYTHTPIIYLGFKMYSSHTVTQTIPATYRGCIYVLSGTTYIWDPNSETEAKAHHTLIFSEDNNSTVRV